MVLLEELKSILGYIVSTDYFDEYGHVRFNVFIHICVGLWGVFLLFSMFEFETLWLFTDQQTAFVALGALFSGLAFAGIAFTIFQQKESLRQQREMLESQDINMFHDVLFKLIAAHQEKIKVLFPESNTISRSDYVRDLLDDFKTYYDQQGTHDEWRNEYEWITQVVNNFFDEHLKGRELLYSIKRVCNHIEYSNVSKSIKDDAYETVSSSLTSTELALVFYPCSASQSRYGDHVYGPLFWRSDVFLHDEIKHFLLHDQHKEMFKQNFSNDLI